MASRVPLRLFSSKPPPPLSATPSATVKLADIRPRLTIPFPFGPVDALRIFNEDFQRKFGPLQWEYDVENIRKIYLPFYIFKADIKASLKFEIGYADGMIAPNAKSLQVVESSADGLTKWLSVPQYYRDIQLGQKSRVISVGTPVHDIFSPIRCLAYAGPVAHQKLFDEFALYRALNDEDEGNWHVYDSEENSTLLPFELDEQRAFRLVCVDLRESIVEELKETAKKIYLTSHIRNVNIKFENVWWTAIPACLPGYSIDIFYKPFRTRLHYLFILGKKSCTLTAQPFSVLRPCILAGVLCYATKLSLLTGLGVEVLAVAAVWGHFKIRRFIQNNQDLSIHSKRNLIDSIKLPVSVDGKSASSKPDETGENIADKEAIASNIDEKPNDDLSFGKPNFSKRNEAKSTRVKFKPYRAARPFRPDLSNSENTVVGMNNSNPIKKDPLGIYSSLGLSGFETENEISVAFRNMVWKTHPDLYQSPEDKERATLQFQKLMESYEILKDGMTKRFIDYFMIRRR